MSRLRAAQLNGLLVAVVAIAGCPYGHPIDIQTSPPPSPIDTQAEKSALATVLDSPSVSTYFQPGTLINDGIGIFALTGASDPSLPRRWGRSYPKTVQSGTATTSLADQMALQFLIDTNGIMTANATYSVSRAARFVAEFPWQHGLVTKSYTETDLRTAQFQKVNGVWKLVSLSPMSLTVPSPRVAITLVTLAWGGNSVTIHPGDLVRSTDAPAVTPSQAATVTVQVSSSATVAGTPTPFLFLSRPPGRDRLRLTDNGNGTYTGNFNFAATPGPAQLALEVDSATTFTDLTNNSYDAQVWGLSYLVQGGGAQ